MAEAQRVDPPTLTSLAAAYSTLDAQAAGISAYLGANCRLDGSVGFMLAWLKPSFDAGTASGVQAFAGTARALKAMSGQVTGALGDAERTEAQVRDAVGGLNTQLDELTRRETTQTGQARSAAAATAATKVASEHIAVAGSPVRHLPAADEAAEAVSLKAGAQAAPAAASAAKTVPSETESARTESAKTGQKNGSAEPEGVLGSVTSVLTAVAGTATAVAASVHAVESIVHTGAASASASATASASVSTASVGTASAGTAASTGAASSATQAPSTTQASDTAALAAEQAKEAAFYEKVWTEMAEVDPLGRSADELRALWESREPIDIPDSAGTSTLGYGTQQSVTLPELAIILDAFLVTTKGAAT